MIRRIPNAIDCRLCIIFLVFVLFFFKQKTAYDMRISDWSSDVCSSDLMSLDEVRRAIGAVPGVQSAHDLHVWSITSGNVSCSVHVVVDDIAQAEATRNRVAQMLAQAFQIEHATIQTESKECAEVRSTHT